MFSIDELNSSLVEKRFDCFSKRYLMLSNVDPFFVGIPLKLHKATLSYPYGVLHEKGLVTWSDQRIRKQKAGSLSRPEDTRDFSVVKIRDKSDRFVLKFVKP